MLIVDAYWVHPQQARSRPLKASKASRDVLTAITSSGTIDKASRTCYCRSPETAGCGRGHGVESFVHGYAGGSETWGHYNDELYAGVYAEPGGN